MVTPMMTMRWYRSPRQNLRIIVTWLKDFNYRKATLQLPLVARYLKWPLCYLKVIVRLEKLCDLWKKNLTSPGKLLRGSHDVWKIGQLPEKSQENQTADSRRMCNVTMALITGQVTEALPGSGLLTWFDPLNLPILVHQLKPRSHFIRRPSSSCVLNSNRR